MVTNEFLTLDAARKAWADLGWWWRQRKQQLNRRALERTVKWLREEDYHGLFSELTFAEAERVVRRFLLVEVTDPQVGLTFYSAEIVRQYNYHNGATDLWHQIFGELVEAYLTERVKHLPPFEGPRLLNWGVSRESDSLGGAASTTVRRGGIVVKISRTPKIWFFVGDLSDRPAPTLCPDIDHAAALTWELLNDGQPLAHQYF